MPAAKPSLAVSEEVDLQLAELAGQFNFDFVGLVEAMFPWGEGELKNYPYNKPKKWQVEVLRQISEHRKDCHFRRLLGLPPTPFRLAIASGHGVGKSALVSWIIQCFMIVAKNARGVVSANTRDQLETKTWPELSKWHARSLFRHWFNWTASTYSFAAYPEEERKNYMFNAATVSEDNSEAFAGLHNVGSVAVVIFDEASGIDEVLYEIADGVAAQEGTEFYFLAFGNPTRPDGPFRKCFTEHSKMFQVLRNIDNRTVEGTNIIAQEQILDKYGRDSDQAKVRVYGQFPDKATHGFIGADIVDEAVNRAVQHDMGAPIIIGVDVARYGDDETVIRTRQGRNARTVHAPVVIPYGRTTDTLRAVKRVADEVDADAIVLEGVGDGAGIADHLYEAGYPVFDIHPNSNAEDKQRHGNLRSEMWHKMKDWLAGRGCIDDHPKLVSDLPSVMYKHGGGRGRGEGVYMESKEEIKGRELPSPDHADSLALTFAVQIARRDPDGRSRRGQRTQALTSEPML